MSVADLEGEEKGSWRGKRESYIPGHGYKSVRRLRFDNVKRGSGGFKSARPSRKVVSPKRVRPKSARVKSTQKRTSWKKKSSKKGVVSAIGSARKTARRQLESEALKVRRELQACIQNHGLYNDPGRMLEFLAKAKANMQHYLGPKFVAAVTEDLMSQLGPQGQWGTHPMLKLVTKRRQTPTGFQVNFGPFSEDNPLENISSISTDSGDNERSSVQTRNVSSSEDAHLLQAEWIERRTGSGLASTAMGLWAKRRGEGQPLAAIKETPQQEGEHQGILNEAKLGSSVGEATPQGDMSNPSLQAAAGNLELSEALNSVNNVNSTSSNGDAKGGGRDTRNRLRRSSSDIGSVSPSRRGNNRGSPVRRSDTWQGSETRDENNEGAATSPMAKTETRGRGRRRGRRKTRQEKKKSAGSELWNRTFALIDSSTNKNGNLSFGELKGFLQKFTLSSTTFLKRNPNFPAWYFDIITGGGSKDEIYVNIRNTIECTDDGDKSYDIVEFCDFCDNLLQMAYERLSGNSNELTAEKFLRFLMVMMYGCTDKKEEKKLKAEIAEWEGKSYDTFEERYVTKDTFTDTIIRKWSSLVKHQSAIASKFILVKCLRFLSMFNVNDTILNVLKDLESPQYDTGDDEPLPATKTFPDKDRVNNLKKIFYVCLKRKIANNGKLKKSGIRAKSKARAEGSKMESSISKTSFRGLVSSPLQNLILQTLKAFTSSDTGLHKEALGAVMEDIVQEVFMAMDYSGGMKSSDLATMFSTALSHHEYVENIGRREDLSDIISGMVRKFLKAAKKDENAEVDLAIFIQVCEYVWLHLVTEDDVKSLESLFVFCFLSICDNTFLQVIRGNKKIAGARKRRSSFDDSDDGFDDEYD
eukprot:jgi/Bigna1/90251/estExt_fgenesh1_pg.C_660026